MFLKTLPNFELIFFYLYRALNFIFFVIAKFNTLIIVVKASIRRNITNTNVTFEVL